MHFPVTNFLKMYSAHINLTELDQTLSLYAIKSTYSVGDEEWDNLIFLKNQILNNQSV